MLNNLNKKIIEILKQEYGAFLKQPQDIFKLFLELIKKSSNIEEQASIAKTKTKQNAKRKLLPCDKYNKGKCLNGVLCSYMHQEFPCPLYYLDFQCPDERCKFLHNEPLPVNILEAFIKYVKTLRLKELMPNASELSGKEVERIINNKQIELLRKKCVGFPHDTYDKNKNRPIDETLNFLSKGQLNQLKQMGVKYHYDVIMLSTWQLNTLGIKDSKLYQKILISCLDIQNYENIGNINDDLENDEMPSVKKSNDNQLVHLSDSFCKFENNNNNKKSMIDVNKVDLSDYENVARLPKDIFFQTIFARNDYLLNHPLPNIVRIREIEKFRFQLKALEQELLNMMPVNTEIPKMSATTMVVVHCDVSDSKLTRDSKKNAAVQKNDIVDSMQSKSSREEISASDSKRLLKDHYQKNNRNRSLIKNLVEGSEPLSPKNDANESVKYEESEHNPEENTLTVNKTDGVDVKDKFRFTLKKCRVMLKCLKEIKNLQKEKKPKQLLPSRRSSERIRMKKCGSRNNCQSKKLEQEHVAIKSFDKEKDDNIRVSRNLKKSNVLPVQVENELITFEKDNQKINDILLPVVDQKIVHHTKSDDKIMDLSFIRKMKEGDRKSTEIKNNGNQAEIKTLSVKKEKKGNFNKQITNRRNKLKVENKKKISQSEVKYEKKDESLLIDKREEPEIIKDNIQNVKETFPIEDGKEIFTTKNYEWKRNTFLKPKKENSFLIVEHKKLKNNKSLPSVEENQEVEKARDKTPEKRKSLFMEDEQDFRILSAKEMKDDVFTDKRQFEESFKVPPISQAKTFNDKLSKEEMEYKTHYSQIKQSINEQSIKEKMPLNMAVESVVTDEVQNAANEKNKASVKLPVIFKNEQQNLEQDVEFKVSLKNKAQLTEVKLVHIDDPKVMQCLKMSDKTCKNKKEEKSKANNLSKAQRNIASKNSEYKESTKKQLSKNDPINKLYREYVKKAQNRKSSLLKLEKALSGYQVHEKEAKVISIASQSHPSDRYENVITNTKTIEENSCKKSNNDEKLLSFIKPQKILNRPIDTENKLFERPFKIPKLTDTSTSEKILSPVIFKSDAMDSSEISLLLNNPFKNNNKSSSLGECHSYHNSNVLPLYKSQNNLDGKNDSKQDCFNVQHQTIICENDRSPATTSQKSFPFESKVDVSRSIHKSKTKVDHYDVTESDCSGSWDASEVGSCNIKKKSSSALSSASNIELTQEDLCKWDDEFMIMNSKPIKSQILPPITSTSKQCVQAENISKTETLENKHFYRRSAPLCSYKGQCMNYLPWVLTRIDIPPYEINKPNNLEQLLLYNEYEDRRLLRHKNMIRLPSSKSFHQQQNDKNRILIFRTLKNSQWCNDKYVAKILLCDLIRVLGDYHAKSEAEDCYAKFDLESAENASEIDRLLNMLKLYINEYGEVMVKESIFSNRNDWNFFKEDRTAHLKEHPQSFGSIFLHCRENSNNPFKRDDMPYYHRGSKNNDFKDDHMSHGHPQSEVFDPSFPHYQEQNDISFKGDYSSHVNQHHQVYRPKFPHCYESSAHRRRYWPTKHFQNRKFKNANGTINPLNHI